MTRRRAVLVLIALSPLLLVACDTDDEFGALENEVVTLGEDFTAFGDQWDDFYHDWQAFRSE